MARDILRERGLAFGPSAVDEPPADAAEPTIEEQLLASDEPLRVLALPAFMGRWGIFLGDEQVAGYAGPIWQMEETRTLLERWRTDVCLRRAAGEAPAP